MLRKVAGGVFRPLICERAYNTNKGGLGVRAGTETLRCAVSVRAGRSWRIGCIWPITFIGGASGSLVYILQ